MGRFNRGHKRRRYFNYPSDDTTSTVCEQEPSSSRQAEYLTTESADFSVLVEFDESEKSRDPKPKKGKKRKNPLKTLSTCPFVPSRKIKRMKKQSEGLTLVTSDMLDQSPLPSSSKGHSADIQTISTDHVLSKGLSANSAVVYKGQISKKLRRIEVKKWPELQEPSFAHAELVPQNATGRPGFPDIPFISASQTLSDGDITQQAEEPFELQYTGVGDSFAYDQSTAENGFYEEERFVTVNSMDESIGEMITFQSDPRGLPICILWRSCVSECFIMLLKSKERISLFGAFEIQALEGDMVIRGYALEPGDFADDRFVRVVAPYSLEPPAQIACYQKYSDFSARAILLDRIKKVTNLESKIMSEYEDGDSIAVLRFHITKAIGCMRDVYGTEFFAPKPSQVCYSIHPCCSIILFPYPKLFDDSVGMRITSLTFSIDQRIASKKSSVIVVVGPKNVGKTTTVRLLVNHYLKNNQSVYLLDGDLGQPILTPAGCVSLFEIKAPLLGISACEQRTVFEDSFAIGTITLENDCEKYVRLMNSLVTWFRSHAPLGSLLFVNTMGWVKDLGEKALNDFMYSSDVDFIYNISYKKGLSYDVDTLLKRGVHPLVVQSHPANFNRPVFGFPPVHTPHQLRDLTVLGYMSAAAPEATVKSFADATPYAIHFRDVAIYFHSNVIFPEPYLFSVLNCTLVALCSARSRDMSKNERYFGMDDMPLKLQKISDTYLRIHGYGLIRAIDLKKKLFYVITPLTLKNLRKVTVMARFLDINIDDNFISLQESSHHLPYVVYPEPGTLHAELFSSLTQTAGGKRKFVRASRRNNEKSGFSNAKFPDVVLTGASERNTTSDCRINIPNIF